MSLIKVLNAYVILYAEDYDTDIWEHYCVSCGVSSEAKIIKIKFNDEDVETDLIEEEEE